MKLINDVALPSSEEGSGLSMKAAILSHYACKKSNTLLFVLDIQGVDDPEYMTSYGQTC